MTNKPTNNQGVLPLIEHKVDSISIDQRANDGYINATALCKAVNKKFNDYYRLKTTLEFLSELSLSLKIPVDNKNSVAGIPATALIQVIQGGYPEMQGTWIHPQAAINLAQWASPKFAVFVSNWVFEWMNGSIQNQYKFPYHIRRYLINRSKIPHTHFSMLDQMTIRLLADLEEKGYIIPAKMMPDISLGLVFSKWLRDKGYNPEIFPTYQHNFDDGRRPVVSARLYPNELMSDFNLELKRWISSGKALKYFEERDENSVEAIKAVCADILILENNNI